MRRLAIYLKTNSGEDYAHKITSYYIREINRIVEHPTKGMVIDNRRGLRRWQLDRHNYVTYTILPDGIMIKNILAYKLNKRGF